MIAFIEGRMTLLMGRVTQDYLINHRLCPNQCTPNLFRVLGSVDALNEQMGLGLIWHDVVHMYECHSLADTGYYLKSRSTVVRLVSCLPKFNKGMKDDYLITSEEWHDGLHCPTREGESGGVPQVQVLDGFQLVLTLIVVGNRLSLCLVAILGREKKRKIIKIKK